MSKELIISREAIRDLEEIWTYTADDSILRADRFIDQLFEKCQEIAKYDAIGRKRDELVTGMLSIAFKKRAIFFLREETEVQIVRILHGAQDIERYFE